MRSFIPNPHFYFILLQIRQGKGSYHSYTCCPQLEPQEARKSVNLSLTLSASLVPFRVKLYPLSVLIWAICNYAFSQIPSAFSPSFLRSWVWNGTQLASDEWINSWGGVKCLLYVLHKSMTQAQTHLSVVRICFRFQTNLYHNLYDLVEGFPGFIMLLCMSRWC